MLQLSDRLKIEFTSLLFEFTPYQINNRLRIIYLEYLYSMGDAGLPTGFKRELLMMDSIFRLLDTAIEDTRDWSIGNRQFEEFD